MNLALIAGFVLVIPASISKRGVGSAGDFFFQFVPFGSMDLSGCLSDTVKKFLASIIVFSDAKVDPIPANDRRSVGFIAELILGEQFEVPGSGLKHKGL